MRNILLPFTLLFMSTGLYAGSPEGGLSLLVQPLPAGESIKYIIDGFFINYYHGESTAKTPRCEPDNYTPYVRRAYLNSLLPEGLSKAQLIGAVNSHDIRKKISKIISKNKYIISFDGVMLYEIKDDILNIYTFEVRRYDKIYTTKIETKLLSSYKDLGHAICSSLNDKILIDFEP